MNDLGVVDRFLDVFSRYIDSGFGLLGGEVAFLTATLVVIDVTLAGLLWAMGGTDDVLHWMAWNIPASAGGIPEGSLPPGSVTGNNLRGQPSYMGPGAPAGPRYHHYVWELYALNANLELPATATRADLIAAMAGKVVAKAAYVGRYRGEG